MLGGVKWGGGGDLTLLVASPAAVLSRRIASSSPPPSSRSTCFRLLVSSLACPALRPAFLVLASAPGTAFRTRCFSVSFLDWPTSPLSVGCSLSVRSLQSVRACARCAARCCPLPRCPSRRPASSPASAPSCAARSTSSLSLRPSWLLHQGCRCRCCSSPCSSCQLPPCTRRRPPPHLHLRPSLCQSCPADRRRRATPWPLPLLLTLWLGRPWPPGPPPFAPAGLPSLPPHRPPACLSSHRRLPLPRASPPLLPGGDSPLLPLLLPLPLCPAPSSPSLPPSRWPPSPPPSEL